MSKETKNNTDYELKSGNIGTVYNSKKPTMTKDNTENFIVAEVTKNWDNTTPVKNLLSQQFELVINTNAARGYKLVDWKFNVVATGQLLTETIIAIFELLPTNQNNQP